MKTLAKQTFSIDGGRLYHDGSELAPGAKLEVDTFEFIIQRSMRAALKLSVGVFDGGELVGGVRIDSNGELELTIVTEAIGEKPKLRSRHLPPLQQETPLRRGLRLLGILPSRRLLTTAWTYERSKSVEPLPGGSVRAVLTDGVFQPAAKADGHLPERGQVTGATYLVQYQVRRNAAGQSTRWIDRISTTEAANPQAVVDAVDMAAGREKVLVA